jgi:HSP20 family protein
MTDRSAAGVPKLQKRPKNDVKTAQTRGVGNWHTLCNSCLRTRNRTDASAKFSIFQEVRQMMILNRHANPNPIAQMRNEINQLLGNAFNELTPAIRPSPAMNVWEDETNYFIEAELPGFSMNDLDVTVLDNEVTIKGTRQISAPEGATYLRRERVGGTFTRTWTLPADVNAEAVEASLRNGVLLLTLPKHEKAQPRKIQVKEAASGK